MCLSEVTINGHYKTRTFCVWATRTLSERTATVVHETIKILSHVAVPLICHHRFVLRDDDDDDDDDAQLRVTRICTQQALFTAANLTVKHRWKQ